MTVVTCLLEKVLNRKLLSKQRLLHGFHAIDLEEKKANMKVVITKIPMPFLAICIKGHLPHLLKEGAGLDKHCDYLLIYQSATKYYAVLVELKSSLTKKEEGKEQLRRSLPILDYLLSVCTIECAMNKPILSVKYVLIAKQGSDRLDKQPIKLKSPGGTDETYEKITVRTLIGTEFALSTLTQ